MRIYIAANNNIDDYQINKAINSFISKFKDLSFGNFVTSEPDVIWFISGGSEHNALKNIKSKNRYCLIASKENNSWSAAAEVKAYLNEKGINTKIFDLDKLNDLSVVINYLNIYNESYNYKLGLIGGSADWLVSSVPDEKLLEEVLDIKTLDFTLEEFFDSVNGISEEDLYFSIFEEHYIPDERYLLFLKKINSFIDRNKLNALAIGDFGIYNNIKSILSVATLNSIDFPIICEGDLCSAAGMIVFSRLLGRVPWMANLSYVNEKAAIFSYYTVPHYLVNSYEVLDSSEPEEELIIKGNMKKQKVTVFRIDQKLEYCFISLGEIVDSGDIIDNKTTQAEIQMSSKSLFLLREFPLGNHHLIVDGDHSDILAEYFTNKGFRIM